MPHFQSQSLGSRSKYEFFLVYFTVLLILHNVLKRNFSSSQPTEEPSRLGARHEAVHVQSSDTQDAVVADSPVTPCCRSKVSVFYPITGISATSSKYNLTIDVVFTHRALWCAVPSIKNLLLLLLKLSSNYLILLKSSFNN